MCQLLDRIARIRHANIARSRIEINRDVMCIMFYNRRSARWRSERSTRARFLMVFLFSTSPMPPRLSSLSMALLQLRANDLLEECACPSSEWIQSTWQTEWYTRQTSNSMNATFTIRLIRMRSNQYCVYIRRKRYDNRKSHEKGES